MHPSSSTTKPGAAPPAAAPPVQLPLLVTGVAGVAGFSAFHYFSRLYPGQVIGTRRRDLWRLRGEGIVACDAEDRDTLARLFDRHGFRSVLHTLGNCKLKHCELDPAIAWRVNVEGTANLLSAIAGGPARLVHLSIDLVYSGNRPGGYVESDPTDPVTVYGKSMVAAEEHLLESRADATILRISLPMGVSFSGHAGAIDWIQSRFRAGRPATLFVDEVRTPAYTDCLNDLFAAVLSRPLPGVFHAGGPRRMSLFQIAQVVNRLGGYDPRLLQGVPRRQAGPMPPRAGDVSMNSHKLRAALGYEALDPWPLADEHVPTHSLWHFGGDDHHQRGSPELLARVLYRNPARSSQAA
ncbi:MAG: sugar nucleotide-binding protein [Planctomycetia bacterium]|nr:sugar nucleotide-binding protein [Planctomycetia bacterium]